MRRTFAALAVLGATLVLPLDAAAQSAMCAEPLVELLAPRAAPEAPTPPRDDDLPWCTSADDPRCAPLPGESTSIRLALRQPLAAAASAAVPLGALTGDERSTPHAGLAPRRGVQNRVERPPRPIR